MNANDALIAVFTRNAFYKRLHALVLGMLALMILVDGILLFVLIYLAQNPTKPLYFATDSVGRLIHIAQVDKPNMTREEMNAWVIEAVQSAYSYDYLNYRAQLQGTQKYFTNYGWSKYMAALQASNNLKGVIERKWIGLARVVDQPKLVTEGMLGGSYAWKFKINMLVTYLRPPQYDINTARVDPIELTVLVQRQPVLQSFRGVGIVQLVGSLMTSDTYNQTQQISDRPSN